MEGDRKYRQRGYRDDDRREERPSRPAGPPVSKSLEGPRSPVMPPRRGVSRCAGCGAILPQGIDPQGKCPRCGFELHCCKQCVNFDTSQRFECLKPIPKRIPGKDTRNDCAFYEMRVTVERETSSGGVAKPATARQAFENLFKK